MLSIEAQRSLAQNDWPAHVRRIVQFVCCVGLGAGPRDSLMHAGERCGVRWQRAGDASPQSWAANSLA